jgi:amino acid adenylation domain-containing protein
VTIAAWLLQAAERWPERGVATWGAGRMTFAELLERAERVAGGLRGQGMAPGDPVVVLTHRPDVFLVGFWGVVLAGGTAVPLADARDASPAEGRRLQRVLEQLGGPRVVRDALPDGPRLCEPGPAPPLVQFSSGSTRAPAGVVLEHRHLLANVAQMRARFPIDSADVKLTWMPHYHDMGLIGCHLLPLSMGMEQVRMRPDQAMRDPLVWLRAASETGATLLSTTNFALARATQRLRGERVDLSAVRHIFNGAEPIQPQVCRAFCAVTGLPESVHVPLYGLAEASVGVCAPDHGGLHTVHVDGHERVIIGPVLDGLEHRVVQGRLQIRGPNVYERLWGQAPHGQEWVDTGDRVVETPRGIAVVGRDRDLIVVNGRNLHADDVEHVAEAVDGVRVAVAIAEQRDGSEALLLQVVLDRGVEPPPVLWALADHVAAELGVQARCVAVVRVPRTTSGKKRRQAEMPRSDATLTLLSALYAQSTGRAAEPDTELRALGTSSIEAVQLLAALERRWGVPLDHGLLRSATLRLLAERLEDGPPRRAGAVGVTHRSVAIVGAACRLPGADSPSALWERVQQRAWGTRVAPQPFDAARFRLSDAQAAVLDPQLRLTLTLAAELLPERIHARTGVFVGAGQQAFQHALVPQLGGDLPPETLAGNLLSGLATAVAHHFDLKGPALTVDTACSASLVALHLACRALRDGECDQALVAGVNLNLDGPANRLFELAGALSPRGRCAPFSDDADGTVPADGAVMLLLRPGDQGLAVVRGTAMNNDGASLGWMAPNPAGQTEVLRSALLAAGVTGDQVVFVEAHGSGTRVGDTVEDAVLQRIYPHARRGAVKGVVGHGLAAAGLTGLLRCIGELGAGELGAVSSFGFGGTNAHVVLQGGDHAADGVPAEPAAPESVSAEGWVHRVRRDPAGGLSWHPVARGAPVLRPGGRYLVTGSSGSIGRRLVAWLRARFDADVVGASRTEGVDLCDADAVAERVRAWGHFDGAFHLAGSLETPDVKRVSLENLRGLDTDFWVFFSSISGVLPGLDQGIEDYARANAWLDRQAANWPNALSISWPPWQGGGMAQGLQETYAARGIPTVSDALGFAALEWALGSGEHHVVVLARPQAAAGEVPSDLAEQLVALVAKAARVPEDQVRGESKLVELGVDSVAALELVDALEGVVGRELPSTLLYEHPTVGGVLAALSGGAMLERAPSTPDLERRCLPAQETFLVQRAFFPDIPGNVLIGCTVEPSIERTQLEVAVAQLAERHPALCMAFERQGEGWVEVAGAAPSLEWGPVDVAAEHGRVFDLERGPVLRVCCDGTQVVLNGHHAAVDAWSVQQCLQDLLQLVQGTSLTSLRAGWTQARQALRDAQDDDAGFWADTLGGAPPLHLPWCGPVDAPTAPPVRALQRNLSADQTAHMARRAQQAGVTLPVFVLAAYYRLLWDHTGQHDVVIRVAQGRREVRVPDARRIVGSFADSLPVRVRVEMDEPLAALAHRVGQALSQVMARAASSARGLAALGLRSFGGPTGLSPAGFSFPLVPAPARIGALRLGDIVGAAANGFTRLGLVCWLFDGRLHLSWNHPESHLAPGTVLGLAQAMESLLTAEPAAVSETLHGRVLQRCRMHPERVAVGPLTYGDLDALSGGLASRLEGERVAVLASPSPDAVVLLLGALRSGAAYVPLDPHWPDARIEQILSAAEPQVLVTTPALAERARALHGRVVVLDDRRLADGPDRPGDVAYIMFTSGSTGRPKGVVVSHAAQLQFQEWVRRQFGVTSADRFVQTSSLGFGGSLRQVFTPLLNGATIHPVDRAVARDPDALLDFIEAERITIWNSVPSMWSHLMGAMERRGSRLEHVRWCLIGGEAVPASSVRRWRGLVGDSVRLANLYGSTETLVNATIFEVVRDLPADVVHTPIGWARGGQRVALVDVHDGVGQVVCGGNLARGYLDPEQTAAAFVDHPALGRVYRTGDLARRLPDGSLVYLGRVDSQVQVHGNRVELGEIEHTLCAVPGVVSAVVVLRDGRLHATVEGQVPDPDALRAAVAARLPHYMVPHRINVGTVPRNAAGKADRWAIQVPQVPAVESSAHPVAEMVRQVLDLDRPVGLDEDFFSLGGDSVQVLELLDRVRRRYGHAPPPLALYARPTVSALLAALERAPDAAPRTQHPSGLSAVQRGFWLAHRADPEHPPAWRACLPLSGPLDLRRFLDAVHALVQRHPMLRTVFTDAPGQRVLAEPGSVWVQVDDLSALPDPQAALEARWREESQAALRLDVWPLVRLRLCRMGPGEHRLILNAHHIVADAWSAWIMMAELLLLHEGRTLAPAPHFKPPADAAHDPWWATKLAGLDQPVVPVTESREAQIHVSPKDWEGLRSRARLAGTTPFVLVLSALFDALAECTGRRDLAVGVAHAARPADAAQVVGPYARALPLRSAPGVDAVAAAWRELLAHADAPPSSFLAAGDPERLGRWFLTWMDPAQVPTPDTRLQCDWSHARYAFATQSTNTEALVGCLVQDGLHVNLHGGPLLERLGPVLERRLLELAAPDGALVVYVPEGLNAPLSEPVVIERVETAHASSELVLIPRGVSQLDDPAAWVRRGLGRTRARHAALGGLLPALTGLGARPLGPQVLTTGHAMTVVAMAWTVDAVLSRTGRSWSGLQVGLLGYGAIGRAVQALLRARLGEPAGWRISDPGQGHHDELLDCGLILGASSGGATLSVADLKPGCCVVDDSFPRCFVDADAIERMESAGDVLLVHGGAVDAGPLRRTSPFAQAAALRAAFGADWLPGCHAELLLLCANPDLGPTQGVVTAARAAQVEAVARAAGWTAAPLHLGPWTAPDTLCP